MTRRMWWALAALALAGCSKTADVPPEEPVVRAAVKELQDAIKADDAAKLWDLLDAKAQDDADRAAEAIRAKATAADAAGKAALAKELGLPAAELEKLTGQAFLKTERFKKKYGELPASTIDKVSIVGTQATVAYTEPDGDKERLTFMSRDGKWKALLAMP